MYITVDVEIAKTHFIAHVQDRGGSTYGPNRHRPPPFWQINHANSAYFRLFLGYFRVISATRPPLLNLGLPFLHILDPPLQEPSKIKSEHVICCNLCKLYFICSKNSWNAFFQVLNVYVSDNDFPCATIYCNFSLEVFFSLATLKLKLR